MSKQHSDNASQTITDGKSAAGDGRMSRRAVLIVAGQAAAASALYACEGKDTGNDDLAMNGDMRGANKDMRGASPDMSGPRDLAPGPDMRRVCMPVVAMGAEALAVDQAKTYPNIDWPFESFIVARDAKGFYALRNVCSHNNCQVNFNAGAKTFDCPCHGSRYNFDGTVLMGPAPLALRSFPLTKLGDGTLQVDPCGLGSTDLSGRVT